MDKKICDCGYYTSKFWMINRIWRSGEFTIKPKEKIYETMIQPIFLNGSQGWTKRRQDEKRIFTTEKCLPRKTHRRNYHWCSRYKAPGPTASRGPLRQ